jgi:23S rRNA pseudouridine1911/1915/1917 synthase
MNQFIHLTVRIPEHLDGLRLDQALAELVPDYSRSRLQQWIRDGQVMLDNRASRVRERVRSGDMVRIDAEIAAGDRSFAAQPIDLDLIYEDDHLLVVNKPPGLVVHPAAGNPDGTLLNALLHHDPGLAALPRAGIVHRLDKDTSGLMVVARTLVAHNRLVEAMQARRIRREYLAVVNGVLSAGGRIEAPIGRHPVDRKRMAVVTGAREAVTHYRVVERFRAHTLVRVRLETGRTHQIRVHMAYLRCPVTGDPVYGGRPRLPRSAGDQLTRALQGFRRQALHAQRLALIHPASGETMAWEAPLPADLQRLLEALRSDAAEGAETDGF